RGPREGPERDHGAGAGRQRHHAQAHEGPGVHGQGLWGRPRLQARDSLPVGDAANHTCHHPPMFRTLKEFFDSLLPPAPGAPAPGGEHTLELCTAVMLVEVMRADATFHPDERAAVLAALREKFALTQEEADRLTELAETTAGQATD